MNIEQNSRKELVFLTGADGMLGACITRELINRGYRVKALVQPNRKLNVLENLNIDKVVGCILDKNFIVKEMEGCDFVIHAAALTSVHPRHSTHVIRVNLEGTRNIMEAAEMVKMKRMVHVGTASSFGPGSKSNPGNEMSPFSGSKFSIDYIDSKYHAQKMLLERHVANSLPVIIINPTYMIGPYDSGLSSGKMIQQLYLNNLPGYSEGGKNFVYSKDVAVAVVNSLTMGRNGECYIAGNINLNYQEFFKKVCLVSNKEFELKKIPSNLIILYGLISSIVARIIRKPALLSYSMARVSNIDQYYSADKAIKELNMPQTPIERAIEECLVWFEHNGFLK